MKAEIRSIISYSLREHPLPHLRNVVALTLEQFVTVGTRNAMAPIGSWHSAYIFERDMPWVLAPYNASRQQTEEVEFPRWSAWVVVPVTLGGCCALPFAVFAAWRRDRRAAMLPLAVLLALAGNALTCGVFSGPHDRYQARLAWLAPLSVALTFGATRRQRLAEGVGAPVGGEAGA